MAQAAAQALKVALEGLLVDLRRGRTASPRAAEAAFLRRLRDTGLTLDAVLAVLSDETRADMVRRDLFRRQVYEQLMVRQYGPIMRGWFLGATNGDPVQADDLVQDVHVKMWKDKLAGYDPARGPFRAWLKAVCRNHRVEAWRRRPLPSLPPEALPDRRDREPSPPHAAGAREQAATLAAATDRLPEPQRRIVLLRGQGEDFAAIADRVGRPLSSVFAIFQRARATLGKVPGLQP
jgi:RNA polymerase sigma factor (sigma-70 family)